MWVYNSTFFCLLYFLFCFCVENKVEERNVKLMWCCINKLWFYLLSKAYTSFCFLHMYLPACHSKMCNSKWTTICFVRQSPEENNKLKLKIIDTFTDFQISCKSRKFSPKNNSHIFFRHLFLIAIELYRYFLFVHICSFTFSVCLYLVLAHVFGIFFLSFFVLFPSATTSYWTTVKQNRTHFCPSEMDKNEKLNVNLVSVCMM